MTDSTISTDTSKTSRSSRPALVTSWGWRLGLLGLAGLGSMLIGNGCSAVLSFNQCQVDSDCDSFEGNWVCDNNQCVEDEAGDETETGDGDGDGDNTGDGDGDTTGDGDGDGDGDTECSHAQCAADNGDTWMCSCSGECINALTTECQKVVWPDDTPQDNVVILGSIMPTSPPFDTLVLPIQNSLELAVEDFNKETTLPSGDKVALVLCDSNGGTAAIPAAQHLVDNLCVPAMIGPVFSGPTIEVAEQVTIPAGVFMITPTATNKNITNLDDNDLVWRPIASDVYQANALADRLEALVQPGDNVVVLHKSDSYGADLAADVAFAGQALDITDVFEYDLQLDPLDPIVDVADHITNTLFTDGGNPPEVIVLVGTSELQAFILGYLQVVASMQPMPFPRFLISHGGTPSMVDILKHPFVIDDDLTQGLLYTILEGVAPVIFDEVNFTAFNVRYMIKFGEANTITTSSLAYDSAMVTLFAASAIPDGGPITGANIAAQMSKLVDKDDGLAINCFGEDIDLSFIDTAVNHLQVGGSIDLRCISGELDFDLATGDVRTNYIGWEPAPINMNPDTPELVPHRIYLLNPDPATDGTWMDLMP